MAVAAKMLWPHLNKTYLRQKGVMLNLDPVYYPGRRRNKYAIIIMSHSYRRTGLPATLEMIEI